MDEKRDQTTGLGSALELEYTSTVDVCKTAERGGSRREAREKKIGRPLRGGSVSIYKGCGLDG